MSYIQNGTIEYGDVNKFATGSATGTTPNPTLVNINSLWGIGSGNIGYGQTTYPLLNVAQNNSVKAADWIPLTSVLTLLTRHQNLTNITPTNVASPALNGIITYQDYATRLQSLWSNRLDTTAGAGITVIPTTHISNSWTGSLSPVFTVTFASGDQARYFFNCGGRIRISFSQTGYSTTNIVAVGMAAVVSATGLLYISSPNGTATASMPNSTFTGFTQQTTGSVALRTVYDTATGYYGLTTSNKTLYNMYNSSTTLIYLRVSARTNGTQGVNGDNGNVITISPTWSTFGLGTTPITGIFATTCALILPETINVANSWGTPTVTVV